MKFAILLLAFSVAAIISSFVQYGLEIPLYVSTKAQAIGYLLSTYPVLFSSFVDTFVLNHSFPIERFIPYFVDFCNRELCDKRNHQNIMKNSF